jgi:hypothetical protein
MIFTLKHTDQQTHKTLKEVEMKELNIVQITVLWMSINLMLICSPCIAIGLISHDASFIKMGCLPMLIFVLLTWFLSYMRGESIFNSSR